ncbi:hypothetical protein KBA27_01030 [bacterium]|nr:hypothetical protein [bacterium]
MKKTLVMVGLMAAMCITAGASFATCPCQQPAPSCPCQQQEATPPAPVTTPCEDVSKADNPCPCGENWLDDQKVEEYFNKMGFSDCQKDSAKKLIEEFRCNTKGMNGGECENKCECRQYRKELRNLDYEMRKLLTQCQKDNYKDVRKDVKSHVKCSHNCLIWPSMQKKCSKCDN